MLGIKQLAGILLSLSNVSHNDLYVGLGTGIQNATFSQDAVITQPATAITDFESFEAIDKSKLSGRGYFGSLFAGYGRRFCIQGIAPYAPYLAVELNGNLNSTQSEKSNSEFIHHTFSNTTIKMDNSYGISLLPGYYFCNNTLFYGRLGYIRGHFTLDTTDSSLANINKNLDGYRLGLGIRQTLTKQLSFRMEWSRGYYQSPSVSTLAPVALVSKTTTYTPNVDQVEFALIYHIC